MSRARSRPSESYTPQGAPFGEFLEQHRAALIAVALDRTGRIDAAEEIAQDVIVRAWEHRHSIRDPAVSQAWLFRITVNACVAWHRRESRLSFDLSAAEGTASLAEPEFEQVLRRDAIRRARKALSSMSPKSRMAALMRIAGYSHDEIAGFLSLPKGAVRGRIARARSRMRRALSERLAAALPSKERMQDDNV
jgi:RNA polymerase sigma-70 factor (ECF subfamily)